MGGSCRKCPRWDIRQLHHPAKRGDDMTKVEDSQLFVAAMNGNASVTDLLLRQGVCDFTEIENRYKSPLHVAIERGCGEVAAVILKHSQTIYEKLAEEGQTLPANTKSGVISVELKSHDGRRVSAELVWTERVMPLEIKRDWEGKTPLVCAAFSTDPKIVHLLLSVVDCMYSETDIADSFRYIVGGITDITDEALSVARDYSSNFRTVLRFLMDSSKFNVNHPSIRYINTFLHDVMRQNNRHTCCGCIPLVSNGLHVQNQIINDVIQLLLEKGADFNLKNSRGETPLIVAAEVGRRDAIQTMFDWEKKSGIKLDLDARDRYGATALIKAVQSYHVGVVRLLLEHKASVNLYDYNGFTALHTAVFDPNEKWFDFDFFCKDYTEQKLNNEIFSQNERFWQKFGYKDIDLVNKILSHHNEATRITEEIVKLLLANDDTNVNAMDFRGNTPLDLAVKSSKQITSATLRSLKSRSTVRNISETEDETPNEVARVDERGRNPLHRLFIFLTSYDGREFALCPRLKGHPLGAVVDFIVPGIIQRPDNLRELVTETDDTGRTPLHYAALSLISNASFRDLVYALLEIPDADINATDIYGKTPLHYAEDYDIYKLFVKCGADEDARMKTDRPTYRKI